MPRVSVIVPNYNHAKFLKQRLDSVLGQTFTDFEILLLDDASTDRSLDVLRQYANHPRIRILLNEVNSGSPFKQWNRGINEASGDYIWIAESDDFAETEFLEELVAVLDEDPSVGIAYCQSCIVQMNDPDRESKPIMGWYSSFADKERWEIGFRNSGRAELANYMVYKNAILNASAVLFKKSLLSDGMRAPESMRLAGDWMFWAMILYRTDLVFLPKSLNHFRVAHPHSQRSKTAKHGLELMEGLDVYEFIDRAVVLDAKTKSRVLHDQLQLWGWLAYTRRLSKSVNRNIYHRLLKAHPETINRNWKLIIIPFTYHFVATPLKRVRPLWLVGRKMKTTLIWCLNALKLARRTT